MNLPNLFLPIQRNTPVKILLTGKRSRPSSVEKQKTPPFPMGFLLVSVGQEMDQSFHPLKSFSFRFGSGIKDFTLFLVAIVPHIGH